jgi:hypothetical protein
MTVSFLSLPFEAVSAITTYVPEEDFLLTSCVSKIWRTACSDWDWTYFHGKGLRDTLLNGDCSKVFLILNSDQLPTETLQKLLCTETVDLLFQKTLDRNDHHLALMNEKERQVCKKNKIFAKKIMKLLFEKCPLIVNREYFLNQILKSLEKDSFIFDFHSIRRNYFTNKRFSNKEINLLLAFLSKQMIADQTDLEIVINTLLFLERRPPFETKEEARGTIYWDLKAALSRAKKENKELSLMDLKYTENYSQKKCLKPVCYYAFIAPMNSILTSVSFMNCIWSCHRTSLGKKAGEIMIIGIFCIIKVLFFCQPAIISLLLAVIGIFFPKTAEKGRPLLKEIEDIWLDSIDYIQWKWTQIEGV